jgi:predicted PurR-regulated permease PerM
MNTKLTRNPFWIATYCFILAALVFKIDAVGAALVHGLKILTPLLIGIVLAFVLDRPYDFVRCQLSKLIQGKPGRLLVKPLSVLTVYSLLLSIVVVAVAFVVPQLSASLILFSTNVASYNDNINRLVDDFSALFGGNSQEVLDTLDGIIVELPTIITKIVQGIAPQIVDITMNIVAMLFYLFIGLILSVYFLLDKERIARQARIMIQAYTSERTGERLHHVGQIAHRAYSLFINGQLIEMMILGILCFVGMSLLRFPYALLISVIIALTNIIPLVGPWIGAILPIFILLMVNPMQAVWFVVFLLVLQQIEGNLIYPRVVGSSIGLPAQWVLLGVIVGGGLFGIVGMLFAVPTTSVLYQLVREDAYSRLQSKGKSV